MRTVAVPKCGLRLPTSSLFPHSNTSFLPLRREIADGARLLIYQRGLLQLSVSGIRSDGNRKGHSSRKKSASNKSTEENRMHDDESSNLSSQEEIIALFRRIQTSITKDGFVSAKKRNPDNASEKKSLESVIDVLNKTSSTKQIRGESPKGRGNNKLPRRSGVHKKEQINKDNLQSEHSKLWRPPSNFVKKSPIPVPLRLREKINEVNEGSTSTVVAKDMELQRIDKLKLNKLKELAKSRGLKGYSKLRKGELVEQLKRLSES